MALLSKNSPNVINCSVQKSPKTDHFIAIYSNFCLGMAYIYIVVKVEVVDISMFITGLFRRHPPTHHGGKIGLFMSSTTLLLVWWLKNKSFRRLSLLRALYATLQLPNFAGNSRSSGIFQLPAGKYRQNGQSANFCPKGVWSPMCSHHFTFYDPSQYLS